MFDEFVGFKIHVERFRAASTASYPIVSLSWGLLYPERDPSDILTYPSLKNSYCLIFIHMPIPTDIHGVAMVASCIERVYVKSVFIQFGFTSCRFVGESKDLSVLVV